MLEIRKAAVHVSKSLVLLDQKITWSSARAHKSKDLRRMWACHNRVLRCSLYTLILGKSGWVSLGDVTADGGVQDRRS